MAPDAADAAAAVTEGTASRELALIFAEAMADKKAEDIVILEVRELIHITHYFVIGSGRNRRMVQAIADEIETRAKKHNEKPLGIEGFRTAEWVLMDYVDVIAHIFLKEVRDKYDLELHWGDAPRVPLPERADSDSESDSDTGDDEPAQEDATS